MAPAKKAAAASSSSKAPAKKAPAKRAPAKKAAAKKPAGPTPEQLAAALQREADALELRRAGLSFLAIADRLEYDSATAAREAFDRAQARLGSISSPEEVRDLDVDRLDRLQVAVWPKALKGDLPSVDRLLKIIEQRDKLRATPKVNDGELRRSFDASVAANQAVDTNVDGALVEAGRKIADRIDAAVANGEGQEVTKALYLLPHLNNILREMLATPFSRKDLPAAPTAGGTLGKLRSLPGGKDAGRAAG